MSQGVPGTWQTFPCSLQTVHSVTTQFNFQCPLISSSFHSVSHSFLPFPFSSLVQWDQVPTVQTAPVKDKTTGCVTVRGHRSKPASTFHSLLQLTLMSFPPLPPLITGGQKTKGAKCINHKNITLLLNLHKKYELPTHLANYYNI